MTFVEKSVDIFDQYYPMVFEKTKTLIIPTSNDLVANYFYGKINPNDHPSIYDPEQIKKDKDKIDDEIKQLNKKGNLLIKSTKNMSDIDKEKTIGEANEHIDKAKAMEIQMERSDQSWNKLANIQRNRERETIMKLINAFASSDIGGVLILSANVTKELANYIEKTSEKYKELNDFRKQLTTYRDKQCTEIFDCIYFHELLGIYVIEVKATGNFRSQYGTAVSQLSRMLIPTSNESMSLIQKLYLIITESRDIPHISGIICTPNAKLSDVKDEKYLDNRFHHFDLDILSSNDEFKQFWINELSNCKTEEPFDLCHYHKFIATMANCSIGRELFGINNALMIAKKITEHNIDPTMMKKRQYISSKRSQTIFLNAKQLEILNDTSKVKLIFGPPGTGKTILTILAAIAAAEKKRRTVQIKIPTRDYLTHQIVYSITQNETRNNIILLAQIELLSKFAPMKCQNGKVTVYTRGHLVEYMKRIFKINRFDQNAIEVRASIYGYGELNENDYIFIDECLADKEYVQNWLNIAEQIKNVKLFVAISGQLNIDKLCSIEEQIMKLLKNEMDYRIFQLVEILRGTKSIIDFWINRLNQILPKKLQMECGHSIVGENVHYYGQYLKSDEIIEKTIERLTELLRNNQPNNIVVICIGSYEKRIIESRLKLIEIAFGSTIELDNNHSLIAVELYNNVYSREWPFVIYVDLFPYDYRFSIISSSRAIAHLTFIERNVKEIRKIIRDKCDDNMMIKILSSFDEYTQFRNEIDLADHEDIMYNDLYINIISLNYFPSQIKQLYPNIFNDCNTFDQFFDIIVNKEQSMLLLFVHQWEYFQDSRHVDKSINLIIEYKQSTEWIESCEIEEMRAEYLINNAKNAIELINKFIQPEVQEMMDKAVTDNRQLFEVLNNSNAKHQFDLITWSIRQIISINSTKIRMIQKVEIDTNEIDNNIAKLLQNLELLANRQQLTIQC